MPALISIFRDILLLRRGPQDLPYSQQLLAVVAVANVLLQLPVALTQDVSIVSLLLAGALGIAFILAALRLMLALRGFANRFVQTATAFLGCNLLFNAIGVPLVLMMGEPPKTPEEMTGTHIFVALISIPLAIWKVSVDANIFRHSLNISFARGLVIALLWVVIAMALAHIAGGAAAM